VSQKIFVVYTHTELSNYVPAGVINPYAGSSAPNGYLLCDGSAVSRTMYSGLFFTIGTAYGVGDGSTTFNLPNLQGRIPVGNLGAGAYFNGLGTQGGLTDVTLSVNQIPAHNHPGITSSEGDHNHATTDPGHAHTQTTVNDDFNNSAAGPDGGYPDLTYPSYPRFDSAGSKTWTSTINSNTTGVSINNAGTHNHTFTTGNTGGGQSHTNVQPYVVVNYIIKV
jgi:microcystin-dependent protein